MKALNNYKYGLELETSRQFSSSQIEHIRTTFDAQVVRDGSIEGLEINSPPLPGDKVEKWVKDICAYLASIKMTVDKKCGMHLHMSLCFAPSDTTKFLKNLMHLYKFYEPLLFAMQPPSRRGSLWCYPVALSYSEIAKFVNEDSIYRYYYRQKRVNAAIKEKLKTTKYCDVRYANLNLHSFFYRGTVEIRMHAGTLNPTKINNWILINTVLFEMARQNKAPAPNTRPMELQLLKETFFQELYYLDIHESDTARKKLYELLEKYITARIKKFNPELGEDAMPAESKQFSINIKRKVKLNGSWRNIEHPFKFTDEETFIKEYDELSATLGDIRPTEEDEWYLEEEKLTGPGDVLTALKKAGKKMLKENPVYLAV